MVVDQGRMNVVCIIFIILVCVLHCTQENFTGTMVANIMEGEIW